MIDIDEFRKEFRRHFSGEPTFFRAPGRVNLIGEHTDYNDGFVMPAAIDFYTWVAIAKRADTKLSVRSHNFGETISFDLESPPAPAHSWPDYVIGVVQQLKAARIRLSGADLLIRGEVPIGAGLSSSAAIEVACAFAMLALNNVSLDRTQVALLCQRAENEFVGMRCGIMDQFISCHGQRHRALMLDCRSLEFRLLPLPQEVSIVICNTMVKHQLAGGEYNQRRAACEEGVRILKQHLPSISALRDVSATELERYKHELPELIYRRCRHVVSEDERVQKAASMLSAGDIQGFGRLMAKSHASLRDDYEVSCRELDIMVEMAASQSGVFGARMTGGGFGGCTVNLVSADQAENFRDSVATAYERKTGLRPEIYITSACDGAAQVE